MFISKRVLIIISAVAVLVVGLAVFAFVFFLSQANQTAASSSTPTPAVTATATTKPTLRACALGTVQSISASSFVVSKGAKTVTVMVDDTTIIRSRGKKVTMSDLSVGDQVRVVAQGTCDKTAQSFSAQVVMIVTSTTTPTPTTAASPTP